MVSQVELIPLNVSAFIAIKTGCANNDHTGVYYVQVL